MQVFRLRVRVTMGLEGRVLHLRVGRFCRHLICATILFAPILIKGACARNDNLQGQEPCSVCSGGGEIEYPDATVPFAINGTKSMSCYDLNLEASKIPFDSELCTKYQANAGYCGCPGERRHVNHCTFCPNGDYPSRYEHTLSTGESCKSLYTYVSFLGEDQCTSLQYEAIASHAYECGCELSMSEVLRAYSLRQKPDGCTLCSDGSSPPDENYFLPLAGMTCGDYADFIDGLNPQECEIQTGRGTFDLFSYQCNCPDTAPPACPKQENPQLCTVSLLNSVDHDESCECYSFCDGEFVGCDSWPGDYLGNKCPGIGISGCNYANAIDNGHIDPKSCSLCPDSTNNIGNPDAILPPFSGVTIPGSNEQSTCRDLVDYLSTQKSDDRDCTVAKDRLAHYCGCDDVEPNCTLCPGGVPPSFKNKIASGDTTCGDFAGTVLTWESETCELGESYLSILAARCGCITADWPVCPVQQNPLLCTTNLLRSANDEFCECYNFCGDQFHSCSEYPGKFLQGPVCPEGVPPIAGCNQALATSQRCSRGSIGPGCDGFDETEKTYLRYLRH